MRNRAYKPRKPDQFMKGEGRNRAKKVTDTGRKLSFINKSLFQIGKDPRPKIDRLIMHYSSLPDQAILDTAPLP